MIGAAPSTIKALKSEQVRHEITLSNGEVDNAEDPLAIVYFNIEVENKTSSRFLIQHW